MAVRPLPALTPAFRAVLLDMDGTLVDSDAAVERAWLRWAETAGIDPDALLRRVHGYATHVTIRRFAPHLDDDEVVAASRLVLDTERSDVTEVTLGRGAEVLLDRLASSRIPWAVVTNAPRTLATARLGAVGVRPPVLVTTDDVGTGKPSPEGFLLAARRLGIPIDACLVVRGLTARRGGRPAGGSDRRGAARRAGRPTGRRSGRGRSAARRRRASDRALL